MMAGCSEVANPSALNPCTLTTLNCFAPRPGKVSIGLTTALWFCDKVFGQGPDQYLHDLRSRLWGPHEKDSSILGI